MLAGLGELLKKTPKQAGARGQKGGGTRGAKKEPRVNAPPTLAEMGVDKKTSALARSSRRCRTRIETPWRPGTVTREKTAKVPVYSVAHVSGHGRAHRMVDINIAPLKPQRVDFRPRRSNLQVRRSP